MTAVKHCSDTLRGWFSGLLRRFDRIVIVGPPKCGKSTLANEVSIDDRPVLRSDDFKKHSWEDTPAEIIKAAKMAGSRWTFEGVMGARALRKGLDAQAVVYLTKPRSFQVPGQIAMGKGIGTVMREWRAKDGGKTPVFYAPEDDDSDA